MGLLHDGSSSDSEIQPCDKVKRKYPLISESMRRFLPTFPTKPRTPRYVVSAPMAADEENSLNLHSGTGDCTICSHNNNQKNGLLGLGDQLLQEEKPMKKKRKTPSQTDKAKGKMKIKETVSSEIPVAMRERIDQMGGYRVQLLTQKELSLTDISRNHGRLLMTTLLLSAHDFLTHEENTALRRHIGKTVVGINVRIIGPSMRETTLKLKVWTVGSRQTYCLATGWNDFAAENGLAAGDMVEVWCFRTNEGGSSELNLCLVKVEKEESDIVNGGDGASSSNTNNNGGQGSDGAGSSNSNNGSCLTEDREPST